MPAKKEPEDEEKQRWFETPDYLSDPYPGKTFKDISKESAERLDRNDARRPEWRIIARHGIFKASVYNPDVITVLARYNNAVRDLAHSIRPDRERALKEFEGVTLIIRNRSYVLETRPEVLSDLYKKRGKDEIIGKPVKYKGKKR